MLRVDNNDILAVYSGVDSGYRSISVSTSSFTLYGAGMYLPCVRRDKGKGNTNCFTEDITKKKKRKKKQNQNNLLWMTILKDETKIPRLESLCQIESAPKQVGEKTV